MGVHDSYRETFTWWAVRTKETEGREGTIVERWEQATAGEVSHGGRGQAGLMYTVGGEGGDV
jgi:hypothetical protein